MHVRADEVWPGRSVTGSPQSDAVNRRQFEQIGPKLNSIDAHLADMNTMGIDIQARMRRNYFNNVLGNPIESAIAVAHLIFDGVLEELPGLKICVAHGGGYASHCWGRMDDAWRARPDCRGHIQKPPSHYLRQLYFDTLVFDQAELRFMLDTYGADHLCLGTDYPFDMSEPDPVGFHAQLSPADRERILGGTAATLLGLPEQARPS